LVRWVVGSLPLFLDETHNPYETAAKLETGSLSVTTSVFISLARTPNNCWQRLATSVLISLAQTPLVMVRRTFAAAAAPGLPYRGV
jgi:hypothetical protein